MGVFGLEYGELVETQSFATAFPGRYGGEDVLLGYDRSGHRYLVTEPGPGRDSVAPVVASGILLEEAGVETAGLAFDADEYRVVQEYLDGCHDPWELSEEGIASIEFDDRSYREAVSAKLLVGDWDLAHNLLVDDEGVFYPVDFDRSGRPIKEVYDRVRRAAGALACRLGLWPAARELEEGVEELATRVDPGRLERRIRSHPGLEQYWEEVSGPVTDGSSLYDFSTDTYVDNVCRAQMNGFSGGAD